VLEQAKPVPSASMPKSEIFVDVVNTRLIGAESNEALVVPITTSVSPGLARNVRVYLDGVGQGIAQTRLGYPWSVRSFGRPQVGLLLVVWGFATLGACGGKSDSSDTDARGGSGASSGGSVTGGTSGSGSGGTSGTGGALTCADVPAGMLCVRGKPAGENETIVVGDRLRIDVAPTGCYSSSCTEVVTETCSVARAGAEFTASAELCLALTAAPNVGCTDDCGPAKRRINFPPFLSAVSRTASPQRTFRSRTFARRT
jgi:hypothetical protein